MLFVLYFIGKCLAENCRPCQTRLTIYEADFTKSLPVSWFNGTDPKWVLSGDATTSLSCKGLEVSAMPYTEWACSPQRFYVDHEKAKLQLNAQPFNNQHLYIEVELTGRTFGTENHPFPDDMVHENDLRLASCGIALSKYVEEFGDFSFMLLLTNDRIYAVWESRAVFTVLGNAPAYGGVFAVPVARRCPEQCHKLAIEVPPDQVLLNCRIWVDGRNIGTFSELIAPPAPTPAIIYNVIYLNEGPVTPIYLSFVHNTFLDGYSPCKDMGCRPGLCARTNVTYGLVNTGTAFQKFNPLYYPQTNQPAQYWDPVGANITNHIWGQGSELFVKRLLVRSITSGCVA